MRASRGGVAGGAWACGGGRGRAIERPGVRWMTHASCVINAARDTPPPRVGSNSPASAGLPSPTGCIVGCIVDRPTPAASTGPASGAAGPRSERGMTGSSKNDA